MKKILFAFLLCFKTSMLQAYNQDDIDQFYAQYDERASDLTTLYISGYDFSGYVFEKPLKNVVIRESNFNGAQFSDLSSIIFEDSQIFSASFKAGSTLHGSIFKNCKIDLSFKDVYFLRVITFENCEMFEEMNFEGAKGSRGENYVFGKLRRVDVCDKYKHMRSLYLSLKEGDVVTAAQSKNIVEGLNAEFMENIVES